MPAIVRVKRRIDEEPHSAFILNGKKRRLDNELKPTAENSKDKDELSTVLKFAGTIPKQDDTATTQFVAARLSKVEAKQLVQQKTSSRKPQSSHTERARQEMRQALHETRFRVVNCMRSNLNDAATLDTDTEIDTENIAESSTAVESDGITIVDIEPASNESTEYQRLVPDINPTPSDSDTGYVYDLYIPENDQQAAYVDMMDDNYLSVRIFDDLVYEDCYNNDDEEYDSEDSNQENYFTNEYPDEDDDLEMYGDAAAGTNSDEELSHAVRRFFFDDDDDDEDVNANTYDSDDDDEDYVHSVDALEENFVDYADYADADRYLIFARNRYKARLLKRMSEQPSNSDDDNEDDDEDDNDGEDISKQCEPTSDDSGDERYESATSLQTSAALT